jgi:prepilin-type N-terminal cleavage/methylation domain-containing protein
MIVRVRRRAGFTLIELMVVLGIIVVLVALSIAAVLRISNAQQIRSSSDVVEKVQVAVDTQVKAIVAQAAKDIGGGTALTQDAQAMINYMGGDVDAAAALLAYCRVRQSFPQVFSEVGQFTVGSWTFPVKSQFLTFQGATAPAGLPSASQQSAMLLYAAVSQTGAGGATFDSVATNAANTQLTLGSVTATVYMDTWQQPIGYCRFGTNAELQSAPYVNTKSTLLDPFDPQGKLAFWTTNGIPNTGASTAASVVFLSNGDAANATAFNSTNRRPVVYSCGLNQIYESLNNTPQTVSNSKATLDDILGYRLTQLGYKGTQ